MEKEYREGLISSANTKRFLTILSLLLFLTVTSLMACEITFEVQGDKKDNFSKNEVIVVKVKVVYTHRICTEGIEATKFGGKGTQILRATKWVETSTGVWERKLQVKITGADSGELRISAKRTCDKEGGYGEINFKQA